MTRALRDVRRGWLWLAALIFIVAGPGCDRGGPLHSGRGRVLLIGLDGATLRLAEPLLREGLLPNLARIAEEGVHGPLQSFVPLSSPRIWTTVATGKVPKKHGILTFVHPQADGSNALYLGSDRKTHALWNITSDASLVTAVVNWWTTFPPERIEGVMITDHLLEGELAEKRAFFDAVAGPAAPTAYPVSWEQRALELARDRGAFADLPNPVAQLGLVQLTKDFETDNAVTRIALAVERELHPDVMMVFMSGIDRVSHLLWGSIEPPEFYPEDLRGTPATRAAGEAALRGYYTHADRLVGLLLERYGREDLVMVVSDHGFEAWKDPVQAGKASIQLTGGHVSNAASHGLLFARGPGVERAASVEGTTVNDVTPTILAWLGLPIGSDMDGKAAAFLDREPPPPIATYDTKPIERVATESRGAEQQVLDQLRGLGYIK